MVQQIEKILHPFTLNFVNEKLEKNYAKTELVANQFAKTFTSIYLIIFYLALSIQIYIKDKDEPQEDYKYSAFTFSTLVIVLTSFIIRNKNVYMYKWLICIQEIVYIIFISQFQFNKNRLNQFYNLDCFGITQSHNENKQQNNKEFDQNECFDLIEKVSAIAITQTMLIYLKIILSLCAVQCWYLRSLLIFLGSQLLIYSLKISENLYLEIVLYYGLLFLQPIILYQGEKNKKLKYTSKYKQSKDLKVWKLLLDRAVPSSIFLATKNNQEQFDVCYLNDTCKQTFKITHMNQFQTLLKQIKVQDQLSNHQLSSPDNFIKKKLDLQDNLTVYDIINNQIENSKQVLVSLKRIVQQQNQAEASHVGIFSNNRVSYGNNLIYNGPILGKEELVNCFLDPLSDSSSKEKRYFDIKILESVWKNQPSAFIVVNEKTEKVINERIREVDLFKDSLLQTISHNLKTPLNGMILFLQASSTMNDIDLIKKYIDISLKNSMLLNEMISDLIDYSQINRGKQLQLNCTSFDLEEVVQEVAGFYRYALEQKKVQLNVIMNISYLDDLVIYNDVNRLKQILHNLIGNAVKFTFSGHIIVQVDQEQDQAETLKITVTDTGIGISDEIKKNLFIVFGTFQEYKNSNQHGVGIGLTICQNLVQLLGPLQQLNVDSQVNLGSSFSFYIYKNMQNKLNSNNDNDLQMQDININNKNQINLQQLQQNQQIQIQRNKSMSSFCEQNNLQQDEVKINIEVNSSEDFQQSEFNNKDNVQSPEQKLKYNLKIQLMQNVIQRNQQYNNEEEEKQINSQHFNNNYSIKNATSIFSEQNQSLKKNKKKKTISQDFKNSLNLERQESYLFDKNLNHQNSIQTNKNSFIKKGSFDISSSTSSNIQKEKQMRTLFTEKFQDNAQDKSIKLEQLKSKEKNKSKEDQEILIEMIQERFKILVVDDTNYNCLALRVLFGPLKNVEIEEAYNGQQAIEKVRQCKESDFFYSLILMDVNMPVMDGLEATAIIKNLIQQQEIPEVPIVTVTAYGEESDKQKCINAGADDHIPKPITYSKMIVAFKELQKIGKMKLNNKNNQ